MASHKSALKKAKQDTRRRLRNRTHRSRLRSAVRRLRAAVDAGDATAARDLLRPTLALVDHTVSLGLLHANAGARAKSRLTRAVNRLSA